MPVRNVGTNDWSGLVLAVATAGSAVAGWCGPGPAATCALAVALALVGLRIVWQDLVDFTIPDAANLALGLIGLTSRIGEGARVGDPVGTSVGHGLVDAAISGCVLWALREVYYRRRGHDGIGLGDVKLAAAGGLLLGTVGLSWAILGASLAGLLVVLAVRVRPALQRLVPVTDRIAFGAVLAPALWATWLAERIPSGGLERF